MRRYILPLLLVLLCADYAMVHATEVFRVGITRISEACQQENFEENPTSGMWVSFDSPSQLTLAFNANFQDPIIMRLVRYIKSPLREEFVAVRSDDIRPARGFPDPEGWFYSIYGKMKRDLVTGEALSIKGNIHASYLSPVGNQNEGSPCLLRVKFATIERIE